MFNPVPGIEQSLNRSHLLLLLLLLLLPDLGRDPQRPLIYKGTTRSYVHRKFGAHPFISSPRATALPASPPALAPSPHPELSPYVPVSRSPSTQPPSITPACSNVLVALGTWATAVILCLLSVLTSCPPHRPCLSVSQL